VPLILALSLTLTLTFTLTLTLALALALTLTLTLALALTLTRFVYSDDDIVFANPKQTLDAWWDRGGVDAQQRAELTRRVP
jgi:hypothetical protein